METSSKNKKTPRLQQKNESPLLISGYKPQVPLLLNINNKTKERYEK